jgi:hypothetical protein
VEAFRMMQHHLRIGNVGVVSTCGENVGFNTPFYMTLLYDLRPQPWCWLCLWSWHMILG